MTCAWVLVTPEGEKSGVITEPPAPENTNNIAEWAALEAGIRTVMNRITAGHKCDRLIIRGDSRLVIQQLTGAWGCKAPKLMEIRDCCRELLWASGIAWDAEWVPRELNERADALGRQAYTDAEGQAPPERTNAAVR
jgi:ribonuclease HI